MTQKSLQLEKSRRIETKKLMVVTKKVFTTCQSTVYIRLDGKANKANIYVGTFGSSSSSTFSSGVLVLIEPR